MARKKKKRQRLRPLTVLVLLLLLGSFFLTAPSCICASGDPGKDGKRVDPFKPVLRSDGDRKVRARPLTPLEKFNIEDLKLLGIALSGKKRVALVQSPDGKLHTLSWGVWIGPNEGRVKAISNRQVVIEETLYGPSGKKQKNRVLLDLYSENTGGEKP